MPVSTDEKTSKELNMFVVGDGGWGTAMAVALLRAGHGVAQWGVDADYLSTMARTRENDRYLPGVRLPDALRFEPDLAAGLRAADLAFVAVPTAFLRDTLARHWPSGSARRADGTVRVPGLVSLTKGIEPETLARPTEILVEAARRAAGDNAPDASAFPVAVLSGPTHAEEVVAGKPSTLVAASADAAFARRVQRAAMSESLRVYTGDDVVGVELAAAVKNVIALAAGIVTGLDLGDNALAALVTRGIAEMTRLGVAAGARPETFAGLAGMGDAIVTCYSSHGRNRAVGMALGRGESLTAVLGGRRTVAEGVTSAGSCRALASRWGVDMPITSEVCRVLFEGSSPKEAVVRLMGRDPRDESESSLRRSESAP